MPDPSPIVKARLKGPLHARFLAEREARGISESELLRLALYQLFAGSQQAALAADAPSEIQKIAITPSAEQSALARKTVWMPTFLLKAASARADEKGMSFSRWAASLMQANLMRFPVLSEAELLAVEATTRELAAIGRHLNQITRSLDQPYFQTERLRLDRLAELSRTITITRDAIGALVKASRRSWSID